MANFKKRFTVDAYAEGILQGDRIMLSRAITLVESALKEDALLSEQVLEKVMHATGNSLRIGITGVPGVGKSTFIEAFGTYLTGMGKKLAVLAIDPSSQKSHGSILGDKTRMEKLSHNPNAYIRPSATGSSLGGVTTKTRESMLLCEAAGFDVIFIETVGVGQSETAVHSMVDFFLLLMLAGAGDELQGIKKGIMEMADAIVINKADGSNLQHAANAKIAYENALHLFPENDSGWYPKVLTASALKSEGLEQLWQLIQEFDQFMKERGYFEQNRNDQNLKWMKETIRHQLEKLFYDASSVKALLKTKELEVIERKVPANMAARQLLSLFF